MEIFSFAFENLIFRIFIKIIFILETINVYFIQKIFFIIIVKLEMVCFKSGFEEKEYIILHFLA